MDIYSEQQMRCLGERLGAALRGGEVIELVGDVGAGKTTLTKGIATALGITEPIQSPTFTISREYEARDNLRLVHYDLYRLQEAGIITDDIIDAVHDPSAIVVIEWAAAVGDVLPADRCTITIRPVAVNEQARHISIEAGSLHQHLVKDLQ